MRERCKVCRKEIRLITPPSPGICCENCQKVWDERGTLDFVKVVEIVDP